MSEVKILKPDKDGILRKVKTVEVPDFYANGPNTGGNRIRKTSYSKRVKARKHG